MKMRFIIGFILLTTAFLSMQGQNITVKSFEPVNENIEARTQPRNDKNGEPCAIIKVGIVGVEDLQFPDAVGDVKYGASEYVVYVPGGLKTLKYRNANGKLSGEVKLDSDYGIEIEKQRTYRLLLDTEDHFRAAVFSVNPPSAKLSVDNQNQTLDEKGMTTLKLQVGKHQYKIEAKGYENTEGIFELTDDELSKIMVIELKQYTHSVNIQTSPGNATLFIDNVEQPLNNTGKYSLQLGEGQHMIRLTADNYKDLEKKIEITNSSPTEYYFTMDRAKTEVITHDEEKSKTAFNVRNFFYINPSAWIYNKNDYRAYSWGWGGELGYEMHFIRILALRVGFGFGFDSFTEDNELVERLNPGLDLSKSSTTTGAYDGGMHFEVPVGIGINLPFYYNTHSFEALFGGYYRWNLLTTDDDKNHSFTDYGLKVQTYLFFHKFSIGAEARKSLNQRGIYFGGSIGFKFYWG